MFKLWCERDISYDRVNGSDIEPCVRVASVTSTYVLTRRGNEKNPCTVYREYRNPKMLMVVRPWDTFKLGRKVVKLLHTFILITITHVVLLLLFFEQARGG